MVELAVPGGCWAVRVSGPSATWLLCCCMCGRAGGAADGIDGPGGGLVEEDFPDGADVEVETDGVMEGEVICNRSRQYPQEVGEDMLFQPGQGGVAYFPISSSVASRSSL